ncbi:hypothetical protein JNUCC32_31245 (plasmid) [Paenibacillus sp. JNUCC32]|nr:hypothetical protein [Paenibacillus sp. JNUCC-32]QOT13764.1 hypothetical protein JNUCC32_31245 [Paenibacillus sp. JNUCC-32]
MARNDEWCDFCDDRLKAVAVKSPVTGREYDICKQCAVMCTYPRIEEESE